MKKVACILGIIFSLLLIAAGVVMMFEGVPTLMNGDLDILEFSGTSLGYYGGATNYRGTQVTAASAGSYNGSAAPSVSNGSYSGITVTSTSFGADFYTYSYRATRAAAHNVEALGEYMETTGGSLLRAVTANTNNVYYLGQYLQGLGGNLLSASAASANNVYYLGV